MHPLELKDLILEGETSTTEFKRKFTTPVKIAKEISAFANTKGGFLIFGVDDDGSVYGVESEKGEIDLVERASSFNLNPPIIPDIEIIDLYGKDIVIVLVEESSEKPHKVVYNPDEKKTKQIAYVRVGEQSVVASREMTKILEGTNINAEPLRMSVGDNERRLFKYLEKHKRATVKDFAKICNISKRRASQLIVRLVRAGVLQIHQESSTDYYTLVESIE